MGSAMALTRPPRIFVPPVQAAIVAVLMGVIDANLLVGQVSGSWQLAIAMALGLTGSNLLLACGVAFLVAKTTVHPTHPEETTTLVVSGLYRWSRNPMYLGLLLMLLGWGVFLGSVPALLVVPLFVVSITRSQIVFEERALAENFGDSYREYQARVRRWI